MSLMLRSLALLLVLLAAWPQPPAQATQATPTTQAAPAAGADQVVHMLDYIAVDYPGAVADGKVLDAGEYAEQQEFAGTIASLLRSLPAPASGETTRGPLLAAAASLAERIAAKAPAADIASRSTALKREVIAAWKLLAAPRQAPDLARGATLYAEHCAGCHGSEGRGDGPLAKGLDPAPANFHDRERMAQRSVYGLYNTVTLGVGGTAMNAYGHLAETDRWALAFHVAGLVAPASDLVAGEALWQAKPSQPPVRDLATLSNTTAGEQAGTPGGPALLAWLTRHPEALASARPDALDLTRKLLADSVQAFHHGRHGEAQRLAVAAYLEGFELVEASLDAVDHGLRQQIEAEMMAFRQLLPQGPAADVTARADAIDALLVRAGEALAGSRLSPTAAGLSAFGILFREGLEAILVLAAIAAAVTRAGRADAMRYVHAGWLTALLAGALTWLAAEKLVAISGATREVTEGVTALVSAAILLYVGFWLHGKAHAEGWQRFLGDRLGGALSRGTLGLLVAVSFLAVYREAFETVLFLQALASQAGDGGGAALAGGAGAAGLVLAVVAWAVFRCGLRLPVALFFRVSAALLALLAIVFAGQGVAALQEAGSLPATPLAFINLPALGMYPTWQTVLAQAATVGIIALALLWQHRAPAGH